MGVAVGETSVGVTVLMLAPVALTMALSVGDRVAMDCSVTVGVSGVCVGSASL